MKWLEQKFKITKGVLKFIHYRTKINGINSWRSFAFSKRKMLFMSLWLASHTINPLKFFAISESVTITRHTCYKSCDQITGIARTTFIVLIFDDSFCTQILFLSLGTLLPIIMATEWCGNVQRKMPVILAVNKNSINFQFDVYWVQLPNTHLLYLRQNRKREKKGRHQTKKINNSRKLNLWTTWSHNFAVLLIWLLQPEIFDWFVDVVRGIEIDVLRIVSNSWLNAKKKLHTHTRLYGMLFLWKSN